VKWWDEEFWATVVITFVSVAVTIALTVWISWWVLNRQLAHERASQARQREEQLADLRAEIQRERRIRQSAGLGDALQQLADTVGGMSSRMTPNSTGNTMLVDYLLGQVEQSRGAVEIVWNRVKHDPVMDAALNELCELVAKWATLARRHVTSGPSDEWMSSLRAAAIELAQKANDIHEGVAKWEDSGSLNLPDRCSAAAFIREQTAAA